MPVSRGCQIAGISLREGGEGGFGAAEQAFRSNFGAFAAIGQAGPFRHSPAMAQALGGPSAYQRGPGHAKRIVNDMADRLGERRARRPCPVAGDAVRAGITGPSGLEDLGLVRKEGIGG